MVIIVHILADFKTEAILVRFVGFTVNHKNKILSRGTGLKRLTVFVLVSACILWPALGQTAPGPAEQSGRVIGELARVLSNRGFKVYLDGASSLRAYRFRKGFEEIRAGLSGHVEDAFEVYSAAVFYDGMRRERNFRIRLADVGGADTDPVRVVLPWFLESIERRGPRRLKAYEASVSVGYNRFHESEPYPKWRLGALQIGADILHDPARHVNERRMRISTGEYFHFRAYANFIPSWKDVWYDLSLIMTGIQWSSPEADSSRTLVGLFTNLELYRPSMGFKDFVWSDDVYKDHPHIQFLILKPVMPGIVHQWGPNRRYGASAFVSAGFSVNSSLCATNITEDMEDSLSPIFRSKYYGDRRQNFYYGWSVPLVLSFTADHLGALRITADYRLYYFSPVEDERAYDVLNVPGGSIGFYLSQGVLATVGYEYWHTYSRLKSQTMSHSWHRINFGLECKVGKGSHSRDGDEGR